MHTPSRNLPINIVYSVFIYIKMVDATIQTLMKNIEVLLLKCFSNKLNDKAPNIPPKGIIPINIACANEDENVIWYYFVKTLIGIVEISVRP